MIFDLLIKNTLVSTSRYAAPGGVAVKDGKIAVVGDVSGLAAETEIDACGLILMPGAIDTQVHFREPGLEYKEDLESGTRAALHGGVTSVLEMPNTAPTTTSEAALKDKLARASRSAWCNYGFFVGASNENIEDLGRLENLEGCPGIKIFMGSSTGPLLVESDEVLEQVLRNGNRRTPIHAEDEARNRVRKALISANPTPSEHPFLRDAESARLATERILGLSRKTGRPVHILHVSTADEIPLIREAKREGLGTTAEVTPQHLWFAAPECYDRLGSKAQMNPPIRSQEHQDGLWKALNEGIFDVFGSDHAPHSLEEKSRPYPNSPSGMPGVQTLLPVLMTFVAQGRLSMPRLIRMLCERPAELYNIAGKGKLEVGFDADLLLVDPGLMIEVNRSMLQSKCGWSPYEGEKLIGWPQTVILGGAPALVDGERIARPGGKMLRFD